MTVLIRCLRCLLRVRRLRLSSLPARPLRKAVNDHAAQCACEQESLCHQFQWYITQLQYCMHACLWDRWRSTQCVHRIETVQKDFIDLNPVLLISLILALQQNCFPINSDYTGKGDQRLR